MGPDPVFGKQWSRGLGEPTSFRNFGMISSEEMYILILEVLRMQKKHVLNFYFWVLHV